MQIKTLKTVFLDRDGVINHDSPDYIKSPEEFIFIPGSVDAIRRFTEAGFQIFIITNQSLINRKMISEAELNLIFKKLVQGVEKGGGRIRDIFYCPHAPDDNCACRKPKPGLILKAAEKYAINLSRSVMVGDSEKDIACAKNAGVRFSVLVKTGNGSTAMEKLLSADSPPDHVAGTLYDAATWIIEQMAGP